VNVFRRLAATLFALAGCALAVSAVVGLVAGVELWVAGVYAGFALGLVQVARRVRPRRRFVFARH
jgi:hypothetical protein